MALRREFSLGHSEFNEFLFAAIGEEKNGIKLTVLSALTRLGLDPWSEAARLSSLPMETAIWALGESIALLPEGDWQKSEASAIAVRLVAHLPRHSAPAERPPQVESGGVSGASGAKTMPSRTALWLFAAVVAALLVAMYLSAG
ncbi:hypothetical protein [Telmatospirillum sp.]|uniref:hypothetical protein n=1 Tax=Telmatospirillum sp. TaxID=2079197 RepID=UPI002848E0FF|nr:hypothetical protein [Telmatospirillum sp.]MDR3435515.1 hypothetical protein [Telmatospirillum sp.]